MNQLTDNGIALIKSFEGLRLKAYQDQGGIWTLGYGHIDGVKEGQECTVEQAEAWLEGDIANKAELPLLSLLGAMKLPDNKYSALVSLVFNCGSAPLHGHLGTYILAKNFPAASAEFPKWSHVNGQVSQGLVKRRAAERKMFDENN